MTVQTEQQVNAQVVTLTPEKAKGLLALNRRNRKISETVVSRYQRDMIEGNWLFAADPIRFAADEGLLDGQHRLTALSRCPDTVALPFLVIRNLDDETQTVMDQGRKRTPGDQLALKGVKDYNVVAAGVKIYLSWTGGLLFKDNKVAASVISAPRIEQFVSTNLDMIGRLGSYVGWIKDNDAPPSVGYAAALAFDGVNPADSREFFRILAKGAGDDKHPITVLDKRLTRHRREGLRMSHRDQLALFFQSWNAWRSGRTLSKFQRPRGGSWSDANFPEPK